MMNINMNMNIYIMQHNCYRYVYLYINIYIRYKLSEYYLRLKMDGLYFSCLERSARCSFVAGAEPRLILGAQPAHDL